jgi:hypothetical protein
VKHSGAKMADSGSIVITPKDPASIVALQDPIVIEQLLENPPAVLGELLAGWFSTGNGFMAAAGCRIAQAAFKGQVFKQFATEFKYLREKGKIPDDFREKKYGGKSWVELLTVLDDEVPDEDRLEALKAMFYSVNKINTTDGEKIANYQLFQIAKKLSSGQLLYLKASYELFKTSDFRQGATCSNNDWLGKIGNKLGHNVIGLLDQDDMALIGHGLLRERLHPDKSGIVETDAHMTPLGIKFCQNIEEYHNESPNGRPSSE